MTVDAAIFAMSDALGPLAQDWSDPSVEDLFVVRPGEYFVKRHNKTIRREAPGLDALAVEAILAFAGHVRGQYADESNPLIDCEMPSGERVSGVLPPCVPHGRPCLSLRRPSEYLPSLDELDEQGLWDAVKGKAGLAAKNGYIEKVNYAKTLLAAGEVTRFWRYTVAQRWSIGFVGETGSGKTHNATAIVMEIPQTPDERIGTVADTEEWGRLPHPNRVSFLHAKGGSITAEMLIEAALRSGLRWLLVQEVRGKEAFAYLRALIVSPGMTTWHARDVHHAFDALTVMIKQHPSGATLDKDTIKSMLRSLINVVAHVERDGVTGKFRATDIKFGIDL